MAATRRGRAARCSRRSSTSALEPPARAADDEPRRQQRVLGNGLGPVDQANQDLDGVEAHLLDRLLDRRQRRLAERGLGDVVEPDHREIVGHREAERRRHGHRGDRRHVVGGEDRGRTVVPLEHLPRGLLRRVDLVAADADERRVDLDPRPLERSAVAALTQMRRLEVGAPGEEPDPAMPELEQVLGRDHGAVRGCRRRPWEAPTSRRCDRRRRPARRTSRRRCSE